jgi:integrase
MKPTTPNRSPKKTGRLTPVFDKERNRWRVSVPATVAADGKRIKAWFPTREEARDYVAGLQDPVKPSPAIAPSLVYDAEDARRILEPWNRDLTEAARELVAALEVLEGTGSLLEAARAYRATHASRSASVPLKEAVAAYVAMIDQRVHDHTMRNPTFKSYCYTLEKMLKPIHSEIMSDITTESLQSILSARAATSRAMHQRNLRAFWKWASSKPRQWADMEVVASLEKVRTSNDSDISILSPDDVKALMQSAEAESPAAAAAYALAVFAGIRMTELSKLKWSAVGDSEIEIGKAISKKQSRRLIPICPTLRAWINATRPKDNQGTICPLNWSDVSKSIRRRAGWDVAARLLENPPTPTRGEWPTNAPRHTCASVQIAIGTSTSDLTFKFGHSGGDELLRKHYVARLSKESALEILSIGPKGSSIPIISAA